jgi:hypothetical protein
MKAFWETNASAKIEKGGSLTVEAEAHLETIKTHK